MYDPINILKYLQKVISTGKGSSLFDSRRKKYYENIADSPIRVLEWNDYKKILSSFINHQTSDRTKLAKKTMAAPAQRQISLELHCFLNN